MKKIGFLSFGHWNPPPHSQTRSASDALLQSIDLAVAAEEVGADGAYFRVHHFARQLASPFPLLAAAGARTSRIELGTGVIDMRYENPLYMAEDAGAADLIAGGRLQLGISRGSPEQVIDGLQLLRLRPGRGQRPRRHGARAHPGVPRGDRGQRFAEPNPRPMFPNPPGLLGIEPQSPGLRDRIWWGAGTRKTAVWTGRAGHEPDELDPAHRGHRRAVPPAAGRADPHVPRRLEEAGHEREPRVSVSRSIFPIVNDTDRAYFGASPAARTRSASSTAGWPDSARRTPGRPTSSSRSSPGTRRSPPRTRCC